jgi:C-terminal processing protease CtpA/Prc
VCGWIVDLRQDWGGNMWPMLGGLSGLLDAGPFGSFVGGEAPERWVRHEDGTIGVEGSDGPPSFVAPRPLKAGAAPVAVLIGPSTASSGEMTAIAFVGRPHTRFFGAPSAGLTTGNRPVRLSDGASINVTGRYVQDRTGRAYTGPVQPDEAVADEAAVESATAWLRGQGCAAAG